MKEKYYTNERSVQILISLLKQYNIRKIIASPGTTNMTFVASMMQDPWFEIYSSVDERSAAYIACGMAAESGEVVVLSCTGATASRNYVSGLTEAYYRKLPILAVTSTQDIVRVGHLMPQVINRQTMQNDISMLSEHIPVTNNETDEWSNTIKINRALLELHHRGGGPVHLNLTTTYSRDFSVKELPQARLIRRICWGEEFPPFPKGRVAIFIGSHLKFTAIENAAIDHFCATHDAVVFCDHTSGYNGKYGVPVSILTSQEKDMCHLVDTDLLIHIGEVSGGYITMRPKAVWRVNPDGELRDLYQHLTHVFEMREQQFFEYYSDESVVPRTTFYDSCLKELHATYMLIPDNLPFSNVWIAKQTAHRLPKGSVLHLGILNSLRTWNFFISPDDVYGYSNTGGFGIDGNLSSLIGASLVCPNRLYYCVLGDLAFFYDMNVVGNRHVANNIRILLVNNGKGTEFRNYTHPGAAFGDDADEFIAAAGHYGNKSNALVKHYAEDLGYEYLSANNKEEYLKEVERFLVTEITEKPMIFEVFTNSRDESEAIKVINNLTVSPVGILRNAAKTILSDNCKKIVRNIIYK